MGATTSEAYVPPPPAVSSRGVPVATAYAASRPSSGGKCLMT